MFQFGAGSKENLKTLDTLLASVLESALESSLIDFSIVEGHRGKEKQNQYYNDGRSKIQWPNGKHNFIPSEAVDAVPFVNGKLSWKAPHCIFLAGVILRTGRMYEVRIRWGGNWDMDAEPITDQDFQDLVHYELVK